MPLSKLPINICIFRWERRKEYTVIEHFVIEVLKDGALPDKEIADKLCLNEGDIPIVIEYILEEYPGDIQGDFSRRSLCDGFTRDLPSGIAIAKIKGKSNRKPEEIEIEDIENIDKFLLDTKSSPVKSGQNLPKSHKEFQEEMKAKIHFLEITCKDMNSHDFRCGDIAVPISLHDWLEKNCLPKIKKTTLGELLAKNKEKTIITPGADNGVK